MRFLLGLIAGLTLLLSANAQNVSRDRVEQLLRDAGCQRELPGAPVPDDPVDPGGGGGGEAAEAREGGSYGGRVDQDSSEDWHFFSGMGGGIAQVVMWLGLGLLIVLVIVVIWRIVSERSTPEARTRRSTKVKLGKPEPPPREVPDYARLAERGEFAAAVHALLQRAFALWEQRTHALPLQATGRDVLRSVRREDVHSDDLAAMVSAVERVYFAGEVADRELYDHTSKRLEQWEATCRSK